MGKLIVSESNQVADGGIHEIANIIDSAADRIKRIVIEKVQKIGDNFPEMIFGVRDNKHHEACVAQGMFSEVDVTSRAIDKKMPGITLFKSGGFWTQAFVVVLTPEGIFKSNFVMSDGGHRSESRPDWKNKIEIPELWIEYGQIALEEILELNNP